MGPGASERSARERPGSVEPSPIRLLLADDSTAQSAHLLNVLAADPRLSVIGLARDGAAAVRATVRLRPDVIVMDLHMPGVDGIEATRQIMQQTPTPIVVITGSTSYRDRRLVFEAMQAGALAVVAKPTIGPAGSRAVQELLRTIRSVAGVKLVRRWGARRPGPPLLAASPAPPASGTRPQIVAIGASTGGPQALQEILTGLPASFPVPVLVVQHISPGFASGLVDWLRPQCALPLALATAGQALSRSGVFLAPSGRHLIVQSRALALTDAPPVSGHRPSATVLFQSVAREYGRRAVAVLLTGMGNDGAAGLRDVKRLGGITVAQDEASSVVFGMPAAAIALGVVDQVLPPPGIVPFLLGLVGLSSGVERMEAADER